MLEKIFTTKMSSNKKTLEKRFTKIRTKNGRFSKAASLVLAVCILATMLGINFVMAAVNGPREEAEKSTDPWGITVTAENVTPTGLTFKITQQGGNIKGRLQTGTIFTVERFENAAWEELPYITESSGWEMPAFLIKENDVTEFEENWEWVYGELADGKYRISKEITDFTYALNPEKKLYYAEFEIGTQKLVEVSIAHPCPDGKVSREFAVREHPVTGERIQHNGVDFKAPKGTDVYAATSGTVLSAWFDEKNGNTVIIADEENHISTFYAHLQTVNVQKGDKVTKNQIIATVGNTGMSTGPHLHFEVKVNGEYADAISLM